ncbi:uncharacterized protein LOC62_01G000959 [Vanrija pseudolonga]|uniref:Right handed beta helix domain-containing protein n=1 Tax=Vanrija pseudolonga TaxID=143232 RepID=A0AAF0Y475_9TREE|nr:hypothetical protein LOC62_01G000959 [Vanrija pseudolonga]
MRLSLFLLALLPSAVAVGRSSKHDRPCLASGDETAINQALSAGGKGTTVSLCPGSVHRLQAPVVFTAPQQTLNTAGGLKEGRDRAMLVVEGKDQAVAIFADCKACSYATIDGLIVDGNRPQLLRVPKGGALIEIGNGDGQAVTNCRLYEPRGWSALHIREGDSLNCRKAYIANNEIGPCGEEWDDDYDGVIELEPSWGNPRADGISLACRESIIEGNTVFDTTDGAIVLFGSAGSEVRDNTVYSRTRVVLGGVNLVDFDPWKGDYNDVHVHDNHFYAKARYFKVGIVVGPSSWSDDTDTVVRGATVTDNKFHGAHFGYAIVVSSATQFTVLHNTVDDDAQFAGVNGPTCPTAPENGKPTAFLINRGSARGTFQEDFVNGEVQHIICVNPPDENGKSYTAWRMRDSAEAIAAKAAADAAEHPELAVGADSRLADALVAYQMTLLSAMNGLTSRLLNATTAAVASETDERDSEPEAKHVNVNNKKPAGEARAAAARVVPAAVREAVTRLDKLERGDKALREELHRLSKDVITLDSKVRERADAHRPFLQQVFNAVRSHRTHLQNHRASHASDRSGRADQGNSVLKQVTCVLAAVALVAFLVAAFRRYRKGRAGTKTKAR